MNGKFLGETIIDIKDTIFKSFKKKDWILFFISKYGSIDGAHHKQWVLDQVARICCGVKIVIKIAEWESGYTEYRVELGEPNKEYKNWSFSDDEDYDDWDPGIAP